MKEFDDISEAFDYCREINRPVSVIVGGIKHKLYPSGRDDAQLNALDLLKEGWAIMPDGPQYESWKKSVEKMLAHAQDRKSVQR